MSGIVGIDKPLPIDTLTDAQKAALNSGVTGSVESTTVTGVSGVTVQAVRRNGIVTIWVEGTATAAIAASTVLATLPAGWRPAITQSNLFGNPYPWTLYATGTIYCSSAIASGAAPRMSHTYVCGA